MATMLKLMSYLLLLLPVNHVLVANALSNTGAPKFRDRHIRQTDASIACNQTVRVETNRTLYLPLFPEGYDEGVCRWKIIGKFKFDRFKVMLHFISYSCKHGDSLKIIDRVNFTHVDHVCGTFRPATFYTYSYSFDVIFTASHSTNRRNGFYLQCERVTDIHGFTDDPCEEGRGAVLGIRGTFSSPGYQSNGKGSYPHSKDCKYTLWQLPTKVNVLLMISFNLEARQNGVAFDWLDIYDGVPISDHKIGRYSGNDIIPPIKGQRSSMLLHFRMDDSISANGFNFSFTGADIYSNSTLWPTSPGCASNVSVVKGAIGQLTSLFYTQCDIYPAYARCSYGIETAPGTRMRIALAYLHVEWSPNCVFDYIEVRDGPHNESSLLVPRICGDAHLGTYTDSLFLYPTSNEAYFEFKADHAGPPGLGYIIAWNTIGLPSEIQGEPCSAAGQTLTAPTGSVYLPKAYYKDYYHNNADCKWTIHGPEGSQIWFQINALKQICTADGETDGDYVRIYDGPDPTKVAEICNSYSVKKYIFAPIKSSGRDLLVTFQSDDKLSHRGLYATYRVIEAGTIDPGTAPGCSGQPQQLTVGSYEFTTPGYDGVTPYGGHAQCAWKITASPGKHVMITLKNIDVEDFPNCTADSIKVYEGETDQHPLIGVYCGEKVHDVQVYARSREALVTFTADRNIAATGFQATWEDIEQESTECGRPDPLHEIKPLVLGRIIEGENANEHSLPWHVLIRAKYSNGLLYARCSGTLLHPDWVLTAGQCVHESDLKPSPPSKLYVKAGFHKYSTFEDETGTEESVVSEVHIYPGYNQCDLDNDIALIKLQKPLKLSPFIKPMCVSKKSAPPGTTCLTSGYRNTEGGLFQSRNELQQLYMVIQNSTDTKCGSKAVNKAVICASRAVDPDLSATCLHDRGGPFICPSETNRGTHVLTGITSHPICQPAYASGKVDDLFTRVSIFPKWIQHTTGNKVIFKN